MYGKSNNNLLRKKLKCSNKIKYSWKINTSKVPVYAS